MSNPKRVYKARLRSEERLRNRILRLRREIEDLAASIEAQTNRLQGSPEDKEFPALWIAKLRSFADHCTRIANLVGLPHALPKPGGRDLLKAYALQIARETTPGASYQQVADALSTDAEYMDGDAVRKASERIEEQFGPGFLAPGSPLRRFLDNRTNPKKP
jgi:hypothetical protein